MPTIAIYYKNKKIESKIFQDNFYVVTEPTDGISWKADGEEGGIEILLWISSNYQINHIRSDWQVTIDNVQWPQDHYVDVDVAEKHLHLRYGEYEFACQFPKAPQFNFS